MLSGKITLVLGLILFFVGGNCCLKSILEPYVYKFGNNYGTVVQVLEGSILPLVYHTNKQLSVPPGMGVSYVEVHVYSLSPPKVDYDNTLQQVSINFSFTQLAMSRYKIIVKAVAEEIDTSGVITIN